MYRIIRLTQRAWNAGDTLSQAVNRIGEEHQNVIIQEWRRLVKTYRGASIPFDVFYPSKPKTQEETDRENAQDVGGLTYGEWKGITGPGQQLKQLLRG